MSGESESDHETERRGEGTDGCRRMEGDGTSTGMRRHSRYPTRMIRSLDLMIRGGYPTRSSRGGERAEFTKRENPPPIILPPCMIVDERSEEDNLVWLPSPTPTEIRAVSSNFGRHNSYWGATP